MSFPPGNGDEDGRNFLSPCADHTDPQSQVPGASRLPAPIAAACVGKDRAGEADNERPFSLGMAAASATLAFREEMLRLAQRVKQSRDERWSLCGPGCASFSNAPPEILAAP